jgi:hypothetical protein
LIDRLVLEGLEAVSEHVAAVLVRPIRTAGAAIANRSELPVIAELAVDLVVVT